VPPRRTPMSEAHKAAISRGLRASHARGGGATHEALSAGQRARRAREAEAKRLAATAPPTRSTVARLLGWLHRTTTRTTT
jgi:hypothetical protein